MIVVDVVLSVLVVVLAIVVASLGLVGLWGMVGLFRPSRCDLCGRLRFLASTETRAVCSLCRHQDLVHPLHRWHHS